MTVLVIIGMALSTYLPRLVPFYAIYASRLPEVARRALGFVPYVALGALIVPAGFTSVAGEPIPSTVAVAVAAIGSLLLRNVGLTLLASVGVAVVVLSL